MLDGELSRQTLEHLGLWDAAKFMEAENSTKLKDSGTKSSTESDPESESDSNGKSSTAESSPSESEGESQ